MGKILAAVVVVIAGFFAYTKLYNGGSETAVAPEVEAPTPVAQEAEMPAEEPDLTDDMPALPEDMEDDLPDVEAEELPDLDEELPEAAEEPAL